MDDAYIQLPPNKGGPIHYLGCRNLTYPDFTGHMKGSNLWVNDHFSMIVANAKGKKFHTWYEPFAGTASWTLNAMTLGVAEKYVINDCNKTLIQALKLIRDNPEKVKTTYAALVKRYSAAKSKKSFLQKEIEAYNKASDDKKALLIPFIFNHVWGGIVFYNDKDEILYHEPNFNGKKFPGHLEQANFSLPDFFEEVDRVSHLLQANDVTFTCGDFQVALNKARPGDFIAMNPPYPSNERSTAEKSTIYSELYGPDVLHKNIVRSIENLDKSGIDYYLTYGRYDPALSAYMLKNTHFKAIGYEGAIFGISLDQVYFSPRLKVPPSLASSIIPAKEVLQGKWLSKQEALASYKALKAPNPEPLPKLYANVQPNPQRSLPPMPPEKRVGFAVVGLGSLALDYVIPALHQCRFAKLSALVTGDPGEKGQRVALQNGLNPSAVYSYDDWQKLKENPDVQVVFITTPNYLHKEQVIQAAGIGKHILCEKPMALSSDDAKAMIDASRQAKVKLMLGYRCHYEPHHLAVLKMVEEKKYGQLKMIDAHYSQVQEHNDQWRHLNKYAGGGSLFGIGIYCLNFSRFITKEEPVEVSAWTWNPQGDSRFKEIESNVAWLMRFESGVVAKLSSSYDSYVSSSLRLYFEKGIVDLDPAFSYDGIKLKTKHLSPDNPEISLIDEPMMAEKNQFALEMDHLAQAVLTDSIPHTTGEDGLKDMLIMEAIYRSAKEKRTISLSSN